ncbi:hypothetical protein EGR_04897 [Echinococcus granulosus]|uniref:Uncharacterized protein n=1 Tax=Echinococcus granulosus TaxID=6210 RepID=W6UPJ2_ECHGR|nr:hypothetical protein EGR_04897 [Echinococcus granulosus]EUB60187.1 hypothetical protein EGR_04897 [Echinococcus granulosus]
MGRVGTNSGRLISPSNPHLFTRSTHPFVQPATSSKPPLLFKTILTQFILTLFLIPASQRVDNKWPQCPQTMQISQLLSTQLTFQKSRELLLPLPVIPEIQEVAGQERLLFSALPTRRAKSPIEEVVLNDADERPIKWCLAIRHWSCGPALDTNNASAIMKTHVSHTCSF